MSMDNIKLEGSISLGNPSTVSTVDYNCSKKIENEEAFIKHSSRSITGMLYKGVKRLFDIIFSSILLILSSPLWLIAVIGIRISNPGPVFYIAFRVGMGGKAFQMYKFRSMQVDNGANEKSLRPDVNRVFRFGAFLRTTKIDELPQILNIFLGQMTVVGPRPAAKDQTNITRCGKYKAIYGVKVGLTSPSALYDYIYGDKIADDDEYNVKVLPTRLDLDLYYLSKRGPLYDLKIIFYTAYCFTLSLFLVQPKKIYNELVNAAMEVQERNKTSMETINA